MASPRKESVNSPPWLRTELWGPSPLTWGTWDRPPAPLWESHGPRTARPWGEVVALGPGAPS